MFSEPPAINGKWQFFSADADTNSCFLNFSSDKLEVDSKLVDFGLHVVGQTISRTITLTNKGALATHFSLDTSVGLCAETSQVQMPSQVSATESQVSQTI